MKKFLTTISLFAISLTAHAATFNDTDGHTYSEAITRLSNQGIIEGDAGLNTFRPDDGINRAEITKIIVLATTDKNLLPYDKSCFPDVKQGQWYAKYVCYAKEQGWVKGFQDGNFKPAQNVSNFEGMKIAAKAQNFNFSEGTPWYADLVDTLSADNLIPYTISKPNADLSRAEMTDLIVRLQTHKDGTLAAYLGNRSQHIVTLETIEEELDLSTLSAQKVCASSC